MREVMAQAEVGDDVFGDDPTVIRLQERVAARKTGDYSDDSPVDGSRTNAKNRIMPSAPVMRGSRALVFTFRPNSVSTLTLGKTQSSGSFVMSDDRPLAPQAYPWIRSPW